MNENIYWERNPILDTYTGRTEFGFYISVRTCFDVAVLYFNHKEIRRNASDGSHKNNLEFAEEHFKELVNSIQEKSA